MSLVIRAATPKDEASLLKLWNDQDAVFWTGKPPITPDKWAEVYPQVLASPTWVLLVAEKDGEVIGYQAQEIVVMSVGRGMAIDPEHRGSGIGRLLLARMEGTLRAKGAPLMSANIHPANYSSLNLFKRAGFSLVDKERWPTVAKVLIQGKPAAPKGEPQ